MIKLERLDHSFLYVNPHQIEFIEQTPDTVITMLSGKKIVVSNSFDEILDAIVKYRQLIGNVFAGNED